VNGLDVESSIGSRPLDGRVALVTGSSSGIGASIAGTFAQRGATVVVNSASGAEAGERPGAEVPGAGCAVADVGDPAQAARLVATTVERYGRLDIVVNDAGITEVAGHAETGAARSDAWEPVLRVSVVGTWNVIRAAAPHLRATGDGVILNVSPIAGGWRAGSSIPYAVCQAALDELTALFASALAPEIHVRSVAPVLDPETGRLVGARAGSAPGDRSDTATHPRGRHAAQDVEECLADASSSAPSALGEWGHTRRAPRTHRRGAKDPRFGWDSLTPAELRVAEAVAAGLTNAHAARRLFVSPHTVDYHLRQIYLKLGISSRVQLAAVLTQH
jgi:ketoreductase RED2